ncbi:MAG TPA: hypothetical protein DDY61_07690, partial [Ruminococcaceae bacterium]|nr:hypothetical protein [Oscillospiraceae bacterium]
LLSPLFPSAPEKTVGRYVVIKTLPKQKSFGERLFDVYIVTLNTENVKVFSVKICDVVNKEKTPSRALTGLFTCGIYHDKILLYKSLPITD